MKKLLVVLFMSLGVLVAVPVQADEVSLFGRIEKITENGRMVKVRGEPECYNEDVPYTQPASNERSVAGTVVGGVVGGLIGHQVGKGSGNTAATIGGTIAGGMIGDRVANPTPSAPTEGMRTVRKCNEVYKEVWKSDDYTVTYSVGDQTGTYRTKYPGQKGDRVKLIVRPDVR